MNLNCEEKKLIDKIAGKVVSLRMTAPAVFMLESMKPLNFIGSQFMLVFSPFVTILFPSYADLEVMQKLLEKRGSVEMIIRAIEARENLFRKNGRSNTDSTEANIE